MLVVVEAKEGEKGKKGKIELPVPVITPEQTAKQKAGEERQKALLARQQLVYFFGACVEMETVLANREPDGTFRKGGFRGMDWIKREGGELVLTQKADQAIGLIRDTGENKERAYEALDLTVWSDAEFKKKLKDPYAKAFLNLWDALATGKPARIKFRTEESADIAIEILKTAGFTDEDIKKSKGTNGFSIKIVHVPEKLDLDALRERLAKNLENLKSGIERTEAAETAQARAERQEEIKKDFANMFGNEDALSNPDLKAWKAAEMIRYVHDSASPSESMLYSVWFLLNKRPDFVQIVNELRAVEPYEPWLRPFSAMRKEEYVAMIKSMREEKPLGEARITPSGKEHEGLLAYEREGRGGKPSELERASALPWEIPQDFLQRLQKGEAVLFYTFPSAERYAEARATVEALFRGRAVSVEHTPEFNRGRDVGEWVMTVHRPGEKIDEGAKAAAGIRWKGAQADPSEKFSIQTNPFSRARGGKTEYISAEEAISDAVNNYSTYSTKFTADPEKMPEWFRTLVTYENYVDAEGKKRVRPLIRENVRKALLAKGVDINVEIAGITTSRWSRDVSYTFRLTISGENVRKPLQAARNEAKKNASEIPPLKRIAAFEGEGETYAARMRRLKEETDKLL